jgi:hypothetical protein
VQEGEVLAPSHEGGQFGPVAPSQDEEAAATDRIRSLNDRFRRSFVGGHVVETAGVVALPEGEAKAPLSSLMLQKKHTPPTSTAPKSCSL